MSTDAVAPVELLAAQLGEAWLRVVGRLRSEREGLADQIAAANNEIYVSPDDRAQKVEDLTKKRRRIDDDLIALGQVYVDALAHIATEAQAAANEAAQEQV